MGRKGASCDDGVHLFVCLSVCLSPTSALNLKQIDNPPDDQYV